MSKKAYLFCGQGSQYNGMGSELYDSFAPARHVYDTACEVLGFDLKELSFGDSGEKINQTRYSQPLIFAHSLAAVYSLEEACGRPDAVAGHSLGEYAALTYAGAFDLETGLKIIAARSAAMQKAAEQHPGAMFAIIGSDNDTIARVCEETSGFVMPVNYNTPAQTVIAGTPEAAQAAADTLSGMGAKAIKLAVNAAFHSKLMEGAAEEFYEQIKNFPFHAPHIPVFSNVTGTALPKDTDLALYLKKHLVSPVQFVTEMQNMTDAGIDTFVEFGPGKTLTSFVRKFSKELAACNVDTLKTYEKAVSILNK